MDSLPDELGLKILQLLELEDILQVRLVSSKWCRLANDETIWTSYSFCVYYGGGRWLGDFVRAVKLSGFGSSTGLTHLIDKCTTDLKIINIKYSSNVVAMLACAHFQNLMKICIVEPTNFTDVGLKYICRLPLKKLSLLFCKDITDDGVQHVAKINTLWHLRLEGSTGITNTSLKYLSESNITSIDLDGLEISDTGMIYLAKLPLTQLWIDSPLISNGAFKLLQPRRFAILSITETKITDIDHIPYIRMLYIDKDQSTNVELTKSISKTKVFKIVVDPN